MMTMRQIESGEIAKSIPLPVTWYLSDIGEAKGKQELFARQSPQRLKVGRYISLERLIEENTERYYETLQESSQNWHEGKHDPWPYIGYILFIIKKAYDEFERRAGDVAASKGEKAELVFAAIRKQISEFRLVDIEKACPGVGRDWVQSLLTEMKQKNEVICTGKGPAARWRLLTKGGSTLK